MEGNKSITGGMHITRASQFLSPSLKMKDSNGSSSSFAKLICSIVRKKEHIVKQAHTMRLLPMSQSGAQLRNRHKSFIHALDKTFIGICHTPAML